MRRHCDYSLPSNGDVRPLAPVRVSKTTTSAICIIFARASRVRDGGTLWRGARDVSSDARNGQDLAAPLVRVPTDASARPPARRPAYYDGKLEIRAATARLACLQRRRSARDFLACARRTGSDIPLRSQSLSTTRPAASDRRLPLPRRSRRYSARVSRMRSSTTTATFNCYENDTVASRRQRTCGGDRDVRDAVYVFACARVHAYACEHTSTSAHSPVPRPVSLSPVVLCDARYSHDSELPNRTSSVGVRTAAFRRRVKRLRPYAITKQNMMITSKTCPYRSPTST